MFPRTASALKVSGVALLLLPALALWTLLLWGQQQQHVVVVERVVEHPGAAAAAAAREEVRLGPASADASERYLVHRFVAESTAAHTAADTASTPCLALHSSLGAAHHVVAQAQLWNASVSHAVFVAPQDRGAALTALRYLRRCHPHVRDRVNFHVVYPLTYEAEAEASYGAQRGVAEVEEDGLECSPSSAEDTLRRLVSREPDHELQYPQNLMRNVARSACRERYVLTADVDMLPPGDGLLAARLQSFLHSKEATDCDKCAFTLPVFETHDSVIGIPRDKEELRRLVDTKMARPFHWGFFKDNQRALQPFRWLNSTTTTTNASYYDVTFEFGLEPVFVAGRGAPPFHEAFVGFGFTRNSQAYEMLLAGWRFVALRDAFLVHRGFQTLRQRPKWRFHESSHNSVVFRHWLREVVVRYDKDPLHLLTKHSLRKAKVKLQISS